MELLAGYDSEESEQSPKVTTSHSVPDSKLNPVISSTEPNSLKRVKISENSEATVVPTPQQDLKKAPLPDVSKLFKSFDSQLRWISKNCEAEINRRMNDLIQEKDEERVVRDQELEQERLQQFNNKKVVEEVIEFKGDNWADEDMLKQKMKKEKEKIFIKNCMQRTTYEIRKARRERRDELLKKVDGNSRRNKD